MSKVIVHMSMSLDGFIAGPNPAPDNPLGTNGHRLHDWVFKNPGSEYSRTFVASLKNKIGAVIMGRTMYDESLPWWNGTGPLGDGVPCFVLTKTGTQPTDAAVVFAFVTEGIGAALTQAKAAAKGKEIFINGGGNTIQQFITAGLVDELHIHLIPILLGGGTSLFGSLGEYIELEKIEVTDEHDATHLHYRLKRTAADKTL